MSAGAAPPEADALAPAERAALGGAVRPALSVAPFVAIALVGQLVAAGNPSGIAAGEFVASSVLLAVALVAVLLPSVRELPWAPLAILVTYVASVATLQLSEGGVSTGSGVLLFVPLIAAALYFGQRESIGVTVAVVAATIWVALSSDSPPDLLVRRVVLWIAVAVLITVPVRALRSHLRRSVLEARRLTNQAQTLEAAARELTSLDREDAIVDAGVRLAALVVGPTAGVEPAARYQPVGEAGDGLADRGDARHDRADGDGAATVVADGAVPGDGPARAACVAVRPGGQLHGYLVVVCEDRAIGPECRDGLAALAQIMEISLSNLFAHRRLEDQVMQEERRRIARELHDGLAHELAFIAARARSNECNPGSLDASELARSADRALDEARRAITVLSSTTPQRLRDGIAQTAEDLGSRYGIPIELDLEDDVDVHAAQAEHLLRIVREAISNAARHGHPSRLTIHLWQDGGHHLVVEDDGVGFELDRAPRGFGLTSMRERAEAVGGALSLRSAVNEGTRVEVHIP